MSRPRRCCTTLRRGDRVVLGEAVLTLRRLSPTRIELLLEVPAETPIRFCPADGEKTSPSPREDIPF